MGILEDYEAHLTNRRYAATSIRNRVAYVRRLAADADVLTIAAWPVEEWVYSHGWQPESLNGAITALRLFFDWMQRSGRREDNPGVDLMTVPLHRKKPRLADDAVLQAALAECSAPAELMIRLAAECGLRRHEIAKVHRDDIDGDRLRVVGKGGRERFVYLSDESLRVLGRMPASGWLFPARAPLAPRTHGTYAMFQAGCKNEDLCPRDESGLSCRDAQRTAQARSRHGIRQLPTFDHENHVSGESVGHAIRKATGLNAHSLRHRAGTAVYQRSGYDLRLTQEFLGHASPAMTARYVHVNKSDLRRAGQIAALSAIPWAGEQVAR